MKRLFQRRIAATALALFLLCRPVAAAALDAPAVKKACDRVGNWLIEQYDLKEKFYGKGTPVKDVMTNAIIVTALCRHPRDYKEANGPFVSEPVKYLVSQVRDDGSLATPGSDEWQALAWVLTALKSTANEKYEALLPKLRAKMEQVGAGKDLAAKWQTEDFAVSADPESLRKQLAHVQKFAKAGTKEVIVEGKTRKWGEVLAENVLKLQQKNGSFGDNIEVNALALETLNQCYKALK